MSSGAVAELLDVLWLPGSTSGESAYIWIEAIDCMQLDLVSKFYDNANKTWLFDHEIVERIRIFNDTADLEIRRDGSILYWRLIADNQDDGLLDQLSSRGSRVKVFPNFDQLETIPIRLNLWGSREPATDQPTQYWYDERVAGSRVTYPVDGSHERVYIVGTEYVANGISQFTRWRRLEGNTKCAEK